MVQIIILRFILVELSQTEFISSWVDCTVRCFQWAFELQLIIPLLKTCSTKFPGISWRVVIQRCIYWKNPRIGLPYLWSRCIANELKWLYELACRFWSFQGRASHRTPAQSWSRDLGVPSLGPSAGSFSESFWSLKESLIIWKAPQHSGSPPCPRCWSLSFSCGEWGIIDGCVHVLHLIEPLLSSTSSSLALWLALEF